LEFHGAVPDEIANKIHFTGQAGWAQVNGRDDLLIPLKVKYDEYYMKNKSFFLDLKILWLTFYIDAYGITTFSPPLFCCSGPVRMLKL